MSQQYRFMCFSPLFLTIFPNKRSESSLKEDQLMQIYTSPAPLICIYLQIAFTSPPCLLLSRPVFFSVSTGIGSESGFEDFGKCQRVLITALQRNISYRVFRHDQKIGRSLHSRLDQLFLRRHPRLLLHQFDKIASGDADPFGKILDLNLLGEMVVDIPYREFSI